jgi:hypothetical protein
MAKERMSQAGVLITAVLAAASLGMLAGEAPSCSAAVPAATQVTQNPNASLQPGTPTPSSTQGPGDPVLASSAQPGTTGASQTASAETASNDGAQSQQLPQTSTILPLLGLIGLGSLVAGLFARR